jgi:hypothetical protein
MAPEQYRGAADLDHRVDIYALGATVYHALAGRPPFEGATVWDVMAQKLELTPRSWPAVSRESVELIAAMMAPDAAKRIGTYEELLTRIDRLPTARASIPPPARRAPAGTRSRQKRWATVAAAAGLLAVAGVGAHLRLSAARPIATADHAPVAKYVSSGAHEALFDNESIAGWLPPAAGGAWKVEADDEGTVVLTGTGFTRRTFARADDYRVTIGLDVDRAAAAEVHFALPARAPDAARRLVLRVTKAAGAVFGTKDGDRGAFRPLAKPVPFPPAEWFDGRRPYLEVRIERAGGAWAVWFNGTEAGRAADEGVPKAAEIRLHAEGGRARVDSVILAKLALKAP